MGKHAHTQVMENYRARLARRGLARFEVQAPDADRQLIRMVARKLTEEGPETEELRQTLQQVLARPSSGTGGILAALRRSPLVGAALDFHRPREPGRAVDL